MTFLRTEAALRDERCERRIHPAREPLRQAAQRCTDRMPLLAVFCRRLTGAASELGGAPQLFAHRVERLDVGTEARRLAAKLLRQTQSLSD